MPWYRSSFLWGLNQEVGVSELWPSENADLVQLVSEYER